MMVLGLLIFAYLCSAFRETIVSEDSVLEFQTSTDRRGNVHYVLLQNTNCTFSYDDALPNGPSHWGSSCGPAWAVCETGRRQSPTNLVSKRAHPRSSSTFDDSYDDSVDATVVDNHHTIVANIVEDHPEILRGPLGSNYQLLQYHYHTPSEHTLNGRRFPLELHLVHQSLSDPNQYAVIGYWFLPSSSRSSLALEQLIEAAEDVEDMHMSQVNVTLKLHNALIPEKTSDRYYQYEGSLTTPPCTEFVSWYVMETPLYGSYSQIRFLANVLGRNARPVQSPHRRNLYYYSPGIQADYY